MADAVALKDRMLRWKEELAALEPRTLRSNFLGAHHDANVGNLQDLRVQVKQSKFKFLSLETQLSLAEGCQQHNFSSLEALPRVGQDLRTAKLEAKDSIKKQKDAIDRDTVRISELYADVSNEMADMERLHRECTAHFQEVQDLVNAAGSHGTDDDEEGAAVGNLLEMEAKKLVGAEQAAVHETKELADLLRLEDEEMTKRRRLEYDERTLKKTVQDVKEHIKRIEQYEKQYQMEADLEDKLTKRAGVLLLKRPRVDFDEANGVVVLNHPDVDQSGRDDAAVRTVKVKYENERLVRAEPHPSLQLWGEATNAIEQNDLARLLTIVWDRVCHESEGVSHFGCLDGGEYGGA